MSNKTREECAKEFSLIDIFIINGAMLYASTKQKEAWKRARAKLIVSDDILTPEACKGESLECQG